MNRFPHVKLLFLLVSVSILIGNNVYAGIPKEVRFTQGHIHNLVQDYIEENMPWSKDAVRFEFASQGDDVVLRGEKISHRIVELHNQGYIGDARFSVKYYDYNTFIRESIVRVKMEVQRDIVVASRRLARDVQIGDEDVHVVKKWVNRMAPNIVSDPKEAIGKRLTVGAAANEEIQAGYLKSPILIKRGAPVRIVYENGSLSVSALGYSEEDGVSGGLVRIRNAASKKTLHARVIDDSMVAIEF
ncbi:MAG: flagellar basal body P-ring formation chaperone FlgA [Deltaproteobacteria bacterium]|nr:flagellar basal body P-ring formation chaperone FlgA [Deltaproteobacteria bacterium]